jgi:hypothetical protein
LAGDISQQVYHSLNMNRFKLSLAVSIAGFCAMAISVVMAFLVWRGGYYGHPSYQLLLTFDRTVWWLQLFGAVLSIIGCIGMSVRLPGGMVLVTGFTGIVLALFVALSFGGTEIFNVHSWTLALVLPILIVFSTSAALSIVGSVRLIRQRR